MNDERFVLIALSKVGCQEVFCDLARGVQRCVEDFPRMLGITITLEQSVCIQKFVEKKCELPLTDGA